MSSAICFNLDQSKILSSGKGLKCLKTAGSNEKIAIQTDQYADTSYLYVMVTLSQLFI